MGKTKILKSRLLSCEVAETLREYLLGHEHDIAIDFEDFGCLMNLFIEMFERRPGEEVKR